MQRYAKALVAVIGAVITAVLVAFPDDNDVQKWGAIISATLTAIAVYFVPNLPAAPSNELPPDVR